MKPLLARIIPSFSAQQLLALALLASLGACQRSLGDHCDVPPTILFQLLDRTGAPLATSATEALTISYQQDGQPRQAGPYTPARLPGSSSPDYFFTDGLMPGKSLQGVTTYYLSFKGKTDTLVVTPQNECGYRPLATFNGRAMPAQGPTATINNEFYQLRRR